MPAVGSGSPITSIQYVSIAIGSGAASNTATISSVDTSLTTLFYNGKRSVDGNGNAVEARIELTNSTTVTATRASSAPTSTVTVNACIVTWNSSMIQSIQRGTFTHANADGTAKAITLGSSFTQANTFVSLLGFSHNRSGSAQPACWPKLELDSASTFTSYVRTAPTSGQDLVVSYEVVEFKSGKVTSVQQAESSGTGTGTSFNVTISSVATTDCILVYRGQTYGSDAARFLFNWELTGATTVNFARGFSNSTSRDIAITVVEIPSVFAGVESTAETTGYATSGTSVAKTVTTYDSTKDIVQWCGEQTSTNLASANILSSVEPTDATTVTFKRGDTSTMSTQTLKARINRT